MSSATQATHLDAPAAVNPVSPVNAALWMEGVGVVRDGHDLVADVDWIVEEGQRWVVLGPNGAGKTTLLRLASAQMFPSSGECEVLGEVLGRTDLAELRTRVGSAGAAVAEQLPAAQSVLDTVLSGAYGKVRRWREDYESGDESRARALLAATGVLRLLDRPFGTLSEGERKRVMVARALMADPELLLLDEPAAGLDLRGREELSRSLGRLAADPNAPTLVLVTHHVEEIPPGFTHVLLIARGRVVAQGPIDTTLTEDALSRTFGLPLRIGRADGRWSARAVA